MRAYYWNDTAHGGKCFPSAPALHSLTPLAQECRDVEIGLLEICDHGVAHAVDGYGFVCAHGCGVRRRFHHHGRRRWLGIKFWLRLGFVEKVVVARSALSRYRKA